MHNAVRILPTYDQERLTSGRAVIYHGPLPLGKPARRDQQGGIRPDQRCELAELENRKARDSLRFTTLACLTDRAYSSRGIPNGAGWA